MVLSASRSRMGAAFNGTLDSLQNGIVAPMVSTHHRQQCAVWTRAQIILVDENSAARQLKTKPATKWRVVNNPAQRGAREHFAGVQFHLVGYAFAEKRELGR